MRCSQCDKEIAAGAQFCPWCGSAVIADDGSSQIADLATSESRLVVGADQTLCLEGRVLGKPADRAAAAAQLAALSGRTHALYSGCCIVRDNSVLFETVCVARLSCRRLSPAFIEAFMAQADDVLLGSAGAYQLEGLGIHLFDAIEGNHATILGLPLLPLLKFLREEGSLLS